MRQTAPPAAGCWLVTGGAGYIGSHVVRELRRRGFGTVIVDDLSTGRAQRLVGPAVIGEVHDQELLVDTMMQYGVTGVIHLAASKRVDESVADPHRYYDNNVIGLLRLLDAMRAAAVESLVFSSSAAVYGQTGRSAVDEQSRTAPINPYGRSKLVGEWIIDDYAGAYGLRYAALRYFNVAGAAMPELADVGGQNLIPRVIEALAAGEAPQIFGGSYDTPDGTCVRDYIDVRDLAAAHADVIGLLDQPGARHVFNVGTGRGYSVREVIDCALEATGSAVVPEVRPARAGDPGSVVASTTRLTTDTAWYARHGLGDMIDSSLATASAGLAHV
jgi:UDP-glucose 4-epimerase